MTVFAVNKEDLEASYQSARAEAIILLEKVNAVQQRLAATNFVGETAEGLAIEMNDKMGIFVDNSYTNVDLVMKLIVDRMNVVVTKLGGNLWGYQTIERGAHAQAEAKETSGNAIYTIDTEDMAQFAKDVDAWFDEIAQCYQNIRNTIAEGTPSWQGPEKITTVNDVTEAVSTILGGVGGTGVLGVGSSLSTLLRDQVTLMEAAG
ncbi:MAG: hypothetical protein AAFO29_19400 [Actinomycetota bacterium]